MLLHKALNTIKQHNMIKQGDVVCVGLSGGADSVCLLLVLKELSGEFDATIKAVHVNHHLRGEESDRDEKFCVDLCKRLDIELQVKHVDVKALSEKTGMSCEQSARELRYDAFSSVPCNKIATAHNLNDNAETVIFNMARGTGLKGLAGIPHVRDNIIRPLLDCSREDIEQYLKEHNQDYVTDSTNLSDDFSRNKIRHSIIPVLTEINSGFLQSISSMTDILAKENEYIDYTASEYYDKSLCDCNDIIRQRCIIKTLKNNNIEVNAKRVSLIENALFHNGTVNLCKDIFAVCKNGHIKITSITKDAEYDFEENVIAGENRFVCDKSVIISIKSCDFELSMDNVHKKLTIDTLDYDKIQGDVILRNRRANDRIMLAGRDFHSSLKKLMNVSVPSEKRWCQAILCDDSGIIWVEGFGADQRVIPDKTTKKLFEIAIRK